MNEAKNAGCADLLQRITEIKDVKYHIFGHIHEGYGVTQNKKIKDVKFINASTVNIAYYCTHKPIMFYVKGRGREYSDVESLNEGNVEYEEKRNDLWDGDDGGIVQKDNANNFSINHSKWMQKRVATLLNEPKIKMINPENDNDLIEICEVVEVGGSASFLNVKGQWRGGYDINIECKWKGNVSVDEESKAVEGRLFLNDVTSEDDPKEWEYGAVVSYSLPEYKLAKKILEADVNRQSVINVINTFVREFLDKKPN